MTGKSGSGRDWRSTLNASRSLSAARDYGVVISAIGLFVALSLLSDSFLSQQNLFNLGDQWSTIGIIACGTTLVIVAGGFDLSIDAVYALSGVLAAWVAVRTGQPELGLVAGVAGGCVLGTFNGLLATVGRINPFVATIASSVMFRGVALLITGGSIIVVSDPGFSRLGQGTIGRLTVPALVFLLFAVVTTVVLARSVLGRFFYAVGGNFEAARYAGIAVGRVQITAYAISGLAAGLAGVLNASRNANGQPDIRANLAFQAITAVVIGGVSIFGGEGTVPRALLGVVILALIANGFNLLDVDPIYQQLLLGVIIVVAVAVDAWAKKVRR